MNTANQASASTPRLTRNVYILAICNAIGFSAAPMVLLLGGIVGTELAPFPSLATLPLAISILGTALFASPAALIMQAIGRRPSFIASAVVASAAAVLAALAIASGSFFLFCLALLILGVNAAFIFQYRFAASESVLPQYRGRAVSTVLLGGIFAGFFGPLIGRQGKDWLDYGPYTGSFVALAALLAASALILLLMKEPMVKGEIEISPGRPLIKVITQRVYLVAAFGSAVAWGVMGLIMSGVPISMHVIDNFSLSSTTIVIQAHIISMYLPSLFSGLLVERFGIRVIQVAGIAMMAAGILISVSGHDLANYLAALILVGIGWNLLFVASTVMLTWSYSDKERFKAQGFNDLFSFSMLAAASLSAGALLYAAGWETLTLLGLPFLAAMMVLLLTSSRSGRERT